MDWKMLFVVFMLTLKIQPTDATNSSRNSIDTNNFFTSDLPYKLLDYLIKGPLTGKGWEWLEEICDDYGHRMTGSETLENVFDFLQTKAKSDGFANVHTEEVPDIPHFKRGHDEVKVIEPREMNLHTMAIPGTKPGIVEAEVVVVTTEEQFKKADVKGKIVVFVPKWTNYSSMVRARYSGAFVHQKGGVGLLVKSITPFSLSTLHTGRGGHPNFDIPIPAASLTLEEAEMLLRWSNRGKKITIRMNIESKTLENPTTSKNLIFDITGRHFPSEVVLLSAHLDSWDVGQGALDDGGGCAAIYFAMKALLDLGKEDSRLIPRRTIRGVFWTGEEQGFYGGKQYFKDHWKGQRSTEKFVFVSETDAGPFKPRNDNSTLNFKGTETQMGVMRQLARQLNTYGIPMTVKKGEYQGDVQQFADKGVPSVGYTSDRGRDWYFNFHHSDADYMNALEKEDIDYTAAIFSLIAFYLGYVDEWP